MKWAIAGSLGALIAAQAMPAFAADKVVWNISVWGHKRAVTAGIEKMAEEVAKATDGNFELRIAYGEAISPAKENLDSVKIGAIEGAQFCSSYHPGKNPVMTVLDLPFLPLPDADATIAVHEAFYEHPLAQQELARWNAMPLVSTVLPQYEFMGVGKPPEKIEDWKGKRVRALGGLGDAMTRLGAIPTTVPAPEVYTGLERGMFDAASFPFSYAHGAYRLHEVSKWYTTNMSPGTIGCHYIMGVRVWEALPESYRQALMAAKPAGYAAFKEAYKAGDEEYLPIFREMGLKEIAYSPEELDEMRRIAGKPVWDKWIADMTAKGIPAQELLDYVLESARKATS